MEGCPRLAVQLDEARGRGVSAFARAALLFEQLSPLSAEEREALIASEPDREVRALVAEMLAGDGAPHAGLATGLPNLGRLVAGALEDEGGSAIDETPLELSDGPYRVLGVLARGGMGVVLRGHDEEIGRDVALKVLRQSDHSSARLRFIEEAQVTGQLEHPGIVPIYHLGSDDAGRPYFAMKLVEGETLAARLGRRIDFRSERARFLGLFLQVCHTVAYAHARRVIHRDLKPANIMVGAFGEVQVLDWGLAKVLGSSELGPSSPRDAEGTGMGSSAPETVRTRSGSNSASLHGTVMGTPRYISPEQAQGEVDRLDRRADVFSLGAILCEILTGEPPFPSEGGEALAAAKLGRVEPALERLARCGADPVLVELAQRCLAPSPADRPADAGRLAAEVERSLAAVEERAHAAELEAEAARARIAAERRARRLAVAFTASAALFALVLVFVFQWRAHERERDVLRLSAEVNGALDRADGRLQAALAAPLDDPAPWEAAALAVDAAASILAGGATTSEVRDRLLDLRAGFRVSRSLRDDAATELARDRAMVARLEEIRMPTGDGIDPFDYPRMDSDYRAAFADFGVDVANPSQARTRLAESDIAAALAQALDQWALCSRELAQAGSEQGSDFTRELLLLASGIDPDPARTRVRSALAELDADALRGLASSAQQDLSLAPESFLLIAGGLRTLGDHAGAAQLLKSAVRRYRNDFWLSLHTALALRAASGDLRSEEAVAYFHGALGVRPDSREVRHLYGQGLHLLGRPREALAVFRELRRTDPEYGHGLAHIAELTVELEGWSRALATAREAVRLAPRDSYALTWYGRILEETGSTWLAVAPLRLAAEIDPIGGNLGRLAAALSHAGRSIEASAVYDKVISMGTKPAITLYNAGSLAWDQGDLARAERLLRRCTEINPRFPQAHCNLGKVLRELGRFEEARAVTQLCHTLGSATRGWFYPSAEWVDSAERASIFAAELDLYLAGGFDPHDGPLALEVAAVALAAEWTATASDWYLQVFEIEGDLPFLDMALAARAAARASAGQGQDARKLSPEKRAVQTERAYFWLDQLRARLMQAFRADPAGELESTRAWLECRTVDPNFAPLRDSAAEIWGTIQADLREIDALLQG